jgi:integrase/recombinase XerD
MPYGSILDPYLQNPCDSAMLRKVYRDPKPISLKIIEKEVVDEIIFRTLDPRDRLMPELMARGGMRVGEALHLKPGDIEDRLITIRI